MRPLEVRKYLFDIDQACSLIEQFTSRKAFADYTSDPMLRSATERQFGIIGEALSQLLRLDPGLAEHISESSRIISFRNRLIHGYSDVADELVWGVVESNLAILRREVAALLEEE